MRFRIVLGVLPFLAVWPVGAQVAPITKNPIPEPIVKRGIAVEVKDVLRLPDSRELHPSDQDVDAGAYARVSYVRDLPDGRRFANDSRGILYLIDANNQPQVYLNLAAAFPNLIYNRLESGFIGFVFHPEFAKNGLFYTVHSERAAGNPKVPDFIPIGYGLKDVTYHNVITEWHATNPAASTFEGTRRELLRESHVVANLTHPMGAVEFNPTAKPGDEDYGLLYTSGSDHGFSNGGGPNASNPAQTQRLDSIIGAILRIDPRSPSVTHGQKGLGDYTIPMANKFAADGDPNTLGEIYAYGFRNAHRLSWDTDGTMFASDIGMSQIEEINIVHNGGNYGWMKREGYFENARIRGGALDALYPAAAGDSERESEGRIYLSRGGLRSRRRPLGDRRLRLSRQDCRAARKIRVRRHLRRTRVCLRSGGDEKGRRRHSRNRRAGRGSPALRTRCQRQARGRIVQGVGREKDGATHDAGRSAHQPQPRGRAVPDFQAGRNDSHACAGRRQVMR